VDDEHQRVFGEAADRCQQLFGLLGRGLLVPRPERARDAMLHVVIEDLQRETLERGGHCAELRQDVDAVAVVLDHALDPAHLSFDAVQALDQCFLVLGVPVGHVPPSIPPRGICA